MDVYPIDTLKRNLDAYTKPVCTNTYGFPKTTFSASISIRNKRFVLSKRIYTRSIR